MDDVAYYQELKRLDAEQGIDDPAASAAALAGATVTLTDQPFKWKDAKDAARRNGDWPKIVVRSRQVPVVPPETDIDDAILAAVDVVESADTDMIDPLSDVWLEDTAALRAVGDISDATATTLSELDTVTMPALSRDPTPEDVVAAREQF